MAGPRQKTVDGQKLLSMAGLAEKLGKSKRTVQRAEADGKLPKPAHTTSKEGLLGHGAERWYAPDEVQAAIALFAREEQQQQEATRTRLVPSPRRPWNTTDSKRTEIKRWQHLQDPTRQDTPEVEAAAMGEERCPHCGAKDTLVWQPRWSEVALKEEPFCDNCGCAVVLEEDNPPEPEAWGSSGAGGYPVSVFSSALASSTARRRPQPLTTVRGAVRTQRPSRPKVNIPLPPLG
jgi:hypothetical protein